MNGKVVTYCRVSTARQGRSGLGLEAQRASINAYLNGGNWQMVAEYVEVESGKRSENRPQLQEALSMCRLHRAKLVIAKLDRLARNVAFVSALMESKVKFVAVDLPEANELTIHIMSAMAEHEAKAISQRTRAALAVSKRRGKVLGGRRVSRERWDQIAVAGRVESQRVRSEMACGWASDVLPIIKDIRKHGAESLREIAAALNERGIDTRRGCPQWSAVQVARVLATT
jgi:DNA invertase Pin-like site-specific DNA recombinase